MWQRDFGSALFAALLLVACGGGSVPSGKVASTQASIRGAEVAGAEQNPQAAMHLKLARDQAARADRLIKDDEYEKAELTLNQAQADADLALGLAREAQERQQAEQAKARIDELRSQMQTQTK